MAIMPSFEHFCSFITFDVHPNKHKHNEFGNDGKSDANDSYFDV